MIKFVANKPIITGYPVVVGDVQKVLTHYPANFFDACLTDPPYGLSFMGKAWDKGVPSAEVWRSVYQVLKPGGMMLAFGGTRTHHRLMCAIEEAGFELRDCLMWLYGSGFPKSHDISKDIDKQAGVAKVWDGYGTALKPAWEPIILAMKPCDGTFAENALKYGVAGLNIDGSRIGTQERTYDLKGGENLNRLSRLTANDSTDAKGCGAYGVGAEQITIGSTTVTGRWPANVLLDEVAANMLDEQSGISVSSGGQASLGAFRNGKIYGSGRDEVEKRDPGLGDSGGASRFFYVAKASSSERGKDNNHPTVKPKKLNAKLAEYLLKLVLPPEREGDDRKLLVPFCGSGSEMFGARAAGWDSALGIDISHEYAHIVEGRHLRGSIDTA